MSWTSTEESISTRESGQPDQNCQWPSRRKAENIGSSCTWFGGLKSSLVIRWGERWLEWVEGTTAGGAGDSENRPPCPDVLLWRGVGEQDVADRRPECCLLLFLNVRHMSCTLKMRMCYKGEDCWFRIEGGGLLEWCPWKVEKEWTFRVAHPLGLPGNFSAIKVLYPWKP